MMSDNFGEKATSTSPPSLKDLRITGTEVHYAVLCPRKLWWYSHGMEQEHVEGNTGAENVSLGQQLHERAYPQQVRKDILIDGLIRLDFTDDGEVHEIKKSKGGERASKMQLLYYLHYLKHVKGIETTGVLDYPDQKRRETLTLTPALEAEVETTLTLVLETRARPAPPPVEKPMSLCAKCSYQDLCWG